MVGTITVEKGIYPNPGRDALRKLFAPELKKGVLLEVMKRSKSREFVSQEDVEEEFGLSGRSER